MGKSLTWCAGNTDSTFMSQRSLPSSRMSIDKTTLSKFNDILNSLTREDSIDDIHRKKVLHKALDVLNITKEPIDKHYIIGDVLGSGKYGLVKEGVSKRNTELHVAIKTINLSSVKDKFHIIAQEILIMKRVDHHSIVKVFEIYRDQEKIHIVMELLEGKELFDFLFQRDRLKESEAATIIKQLVQWIAYLNSNNIWHRDIKLENIVIDSFKFQIKILDFGFSWYYEEGVLMDTKVGTPYYIAPEVLKGKYGPEWDMWSIGVIAYIMLVGSPPFHSKEVNNILRNILNKKVEYDTEIWDKLSPEAADFVQSWLTKDPRNRIKPNDALKHKWIRQEMEKDTEIGSRVIKKLFSNRNTDELKKEIFLVMMNNMSPDSKQKWDKWFDVLDIDQKGEIKTSVLLEKLTELECNPNRRKKIKKILETNKETVINYSDFMTNVINPTKDFTDKDIENAFKFFDTNSCGTISYIDINNYLSRKGENTTEQKGITLFEKVDSNTKSTKMIDPDNIKSEGLVKNIDYDDEDTKTDQQPSTNTTDSK